MLPFPFISTASEIILSVIFNRAALPIVPLSIVLIWVTVWSPSPGPRATLHFVISPLASSARDLLRLLSPRAQWVPALCLSERGSVTKHEASAGKEAGAREGVWGAGSLSSTAQCKYSVNAHTLSSCTASVSALTVTEMCSLTLTKALTVKWDGKEVAHRENKSVSQS